MGLPGRQQTKAVLCLSQEHFLNAPVKEQCFLTFAQQNGNWQQYKCWLKIYVGDSNFSSFGNFRLSVIHLRNISKYLVCKWLCARPSGGLESVLCRKLEVKRQGYNGMNLNPNESGFKNLSKK